MAVDCFLLESLEADGFTVMAAAGVLSIGPRERLTPELRQSIKEAKRYILDDLEARQRQADVAHWHAIATEAGRR